MIMDKTKSKKAKLIDQINDILENDNGLEHSWKAHLDNIKTNNPSKDYYYFIGQAWMGVWKKLDDLGTLEAEEQKGFIEENVFIEIFKFAMTLPRKLASKFIYVVEGMVDNKKSSAGHMLSRITADILWKVLSSANMICRYNAACVFFHLYPMAESDIDLEFSIKDKQHSTMLELFKDDCYQIRVDAVKKIFELLSLSWVGIKNEHRKEYLAIIIDELSKDDSAEVRLAIYENLPALYTTKSAQLIVNHALKIIGPRGLNDPKEKNRIAAVNMLIKAQGKLTESIYNLVEFNELLASIDIEIDPKVEEKLVSLIIPKILTDYNQTREFIRNVSKATEISRNGLLKFFCRIGLSSMISNTEAAKTIAILIIGGITKLKESNPGNMTTIPINETLMNAGIDFSKMKTMFDSAILLFSSYLQKMINERDTVNFNKCVDAVKKFIGTILDDDESNIYRTTILAESALVAASFIPIPRVDGKLIKTVERSIKKLPLDDYLYSEYLKTYVMWNIQEFLVMIEAGLYDIAKELKLNHLIPKRKELLGRNDGGPVDKSRDRFKRTIYSLSTALNYIPASEVLIKKYGLYLKKFNNFVTEFINVMPKLKENTDEETYWIEMYKLHTTLTIICASEASVNNDDFITDEEKENADNIDLDTFQKEYIWFDSTFKRGLLTQNFIQIFTNCAIKHFESVPQKSSSCELVVELLKELVTYSDGLENVPEMKKSIAELKKSALEAAQYCKVNDDEGDLSVIREEDEPIEEADEMVEGIREEVPLTENDKSVGTDNITVRTNIRSEVDIEME